MAKIKWMSKKNGGGPKHFTKGGDVLVTIVHSGKSDQDEQLYSVVFRFKRDVFNVFGIDSTYMTFGYYGNLICFTAVDAADGWKVVRNEPTVEFRCRISDLRVWKARTGSYRLKFDETLGCYCIDLQEKM